MLVKNGPDPDLRIRVFSNFSLLLSFLELDRSSTPDQEDHGAVRLSGSVAKLMVDVLDGDAELMTTTPNDQLALLARGAVMKE